MNDKKHIPDVTSCDQSTSWLYNDVVKDHFLNPRNILIDDVTYESDGVGVVGSPACGDMMVVWIKVDEEILDRLGGLPDRKYHCSVLGHQALREAIEDYESQKTHGK